MEVANGVALRSSANNFYPRARINSQSRKSCSSSSSISSIGFDWSSGKSPCFGKLKVKQRRNVDFERESNLGYYDRFVVYGGGEEKLMKMEKENKKDKMKKKESWNGMTAKKKMKFLKRLTQDLSKFTELGVVADQDLSVDGADTKLITDATEILLARLNQLRATNEELLNRKEREAKAMLEDSSESSDSESDCDEEEVVNMSSLRNETAAAAAYVQLLRDHTSHPRNVDVAVASSSDTISSTIQDIKPHVTSALCLDQTYSTGRDITEYKSISLLQLEPSYSEEPTNANGLDTANPISGRKRVEVCMGEKCKKKGGPALMEEFRRVLGYEGTVVACKCLSKCKRGPNVQVINSFDTAEVSTDDSVRVPSNPLCLGVTLEDVSLIVARYFANDVQEEDTTASTE